MVLGVCVKKNNFRVYIKKSCFMGECNVLNVIKIVFEIFDY